MNEKELQEIEILGRLADDQLALELNRRLLEILDWVKLRIEESSERPMVP